ncbi:phosphotransferase [Candidatus Berkiella aquae]|uniref:Aminoglycoside phosphotransferase family protein n=1 Tax=Candidatus Berkiella aquae TaxID=295108 RepID=A0A0Q9YYM0_9GAMM|nr:phosphotransferase [Candidatus Berkiella aquae]MCS5711985.1 aminoglycoside phosphotransferase family protein [Candidatus Berkiella aquae]
MSSNGDKSEYPPETVIETPWSTVIRFPTSEGQFYLKETPADLIEYETIKAIKHLIPDAPIPIILHHNQELNCFLMNSCGDYSLRTLFKGTIDSEQLIQGLHLYLNILRSLEQKREVFELIGIPDWRIEHIPDRYIELLEKKDLVLNEGFTSSELEKLIDLVPTIKTICHFLAEQNIKDTLVNSDFNENNLIIDKHTQHISIVDWGECVISHPFFSIAAHLQNNARRYQLELDGPLLENIKRECLSCWLDVASLDELEIIYQNILKLLPVFSSLCVCRLQTATHNKSKERQSWFIAELLKTLLPLSRYITSDSMRLNK